MAWECITTNGTVSLLFTDDLTFDKSIKMNFEVCGLYSAGQ